MNILTIILEIVAILALISIIGLVVYVILVFLPKLKEIFSTVQEVVDGDVKTAVSDLDETIVKMNEEVIPKVNESVDNLNSTTALLQETIQTEIKPITENMQKTTANIQEVTAILSSNVAKLDGVVDMAVDFSQTTIEKAEFCREQLIIPVVEIASFWSGVKIGFSKLFNKLGGKFNE